MRQLEDLRAGSLDRGRETGLDLDVGLGRGRGGQRRQRALQAGDGGRRQPSRPGPSLGGPLRRVPSAFRAERGFGDEREGDHEQRDRPVEHALDAQRDEDGDDDAHPGGPPDRPRPVTAEGDLPVPAEDDEPEDRHEREPDREADQGGTDVPGARVEHGVARRQDEADQEPDQRGRGEEPEVEPAVARLHDERV